MTIHTASISLEHRRRERERVEMMLSAIRTLARGLILLAAFWALVAIGGQAFGWTSLLDERLETALDTGADSGRWVACLRRGC